MPALLLSRFALHDQVCREAEHIDVAFTAALGGDLSEGILDARVQLVKEKEAGDHVKLHLGPGKGLFLLRQRVIFEMTRWRHEFAAAPARALVRALQQTGASSLEALVDVTGPTASDIVWSLL